MRYVGTSSKGIRLPILKTGDNLKQIVCDTIIAAQENGELLIKDKDVIAITESLVARVQGNYATIDDIKDDVLRQFGRTEIGIVFPILSRNRFSILLKGIAKAASKVIIQLSYPSDEVGNKLVSDEEIIRNNLNPYSDVLDLKKYRELFGNRVHEFTGVDYVAFYEEIVREQGADFEIVFSNSAETILKYTKNVIACDIHTREFTKQRLLKCGASKVIGLDNILATSNNGSGFNEKYGLLGSNKASEDSVKLFPRDAQGLCEDIQKTMFEKTGKHVEVMVYGDGAFKDPQGKIWELADPVVSPFHTSGLIGTPNELKLKYLADNKYSSLNGDELKDAIRKDIALKDNKLVGKMVSEGTTPRQLTDLIGSLCDLTSGSGDKGTPVVYVQGYFDNYTNDWLWKISHSIQINI